MFFRIKRINGKEYAYKVKNKWTENGPRQKVAGYLGKVYRLQKKTDLSFESFVTDIKGKMFAEYLNSLDFDNGIMDLVHWELTRHGLEKKDREQGNVFGHPEIDSEIEIGKGFVMAKSREAVLKMNDGYLCSSTLKEVFGAGLVEEQEEGMDLAKTLINAGLQVPQEVFVKLYEKLS